MVFNTPCFLRNMNDQRQVYTFARDSNKNITGQLSIDNKDDGKIEFFKTEQNARKKRMALLSRGWKLASPREEGITLPLNYFNPQKPTLHWYCGRDEKGRLSSVFKNEEDKENIIFEYLDNIDQVKESLKILVNEGWRETPKPKIEFDQATEATKTVDEIMQEEKIEEFNDLLNKNLGNKIKELREQQKK